MTLVDALDDPNHPNCQIACAAQGRSATRMSREAAYDTKTALRFNPELRVFAVRSSILLVDRKSSV
jgi:hypothetical protein